MPWCLQADNTFLDHKNFAAFGTVTWNLELMQRVINPTPGATDGVDQDAYYEHGNTCAATSTSFWEHFNFSLITQLCSATGAVWCVVPGTLCSALVPCLGRMLIGACNHPMPWPIRPFRVCGALPEPFDDPRCRGHLHR